VAYRLWEEAGHRALPEFAPPEITSADLAPLLLRLAKWGSGDPAGLPWLDPPPEAAVAAARAALEALGALADGRITPLGEAIASLPMAPDQAAAVLHGAAAGCGEDAARLIMLLQERGLGGRGEDLAQRSRAAQCGCGADCGGLGGAGGQACGRDRRQSGRQCRRSSGACPA
jgi:ATP-dependent helicase HrpB